MRRRLAFAAATAMVAAATFAGSASATTLSVTMPCGCKPLHDFAGETGYQQPVGVPSDSPAISNPSGTAGHADTSSGLGITGEGLIYPSGQALFTP